MMKLVRLIRHGESASNAGAATQDHASIPLTEHGVDQARRVALSFANAPDLIVTSPFSRALATAQFTTSAFPSVPMATWPVQEFTYLEPARCVNTTVAQRREWVDDYWQRADPNHIDGHGAESFLEFVLRAQAFLGRAAAHQAKDIVVFSHGQFINAVAWLIERRPTEIDSQAMTDWREYEIANHVENCGGYQLMYGQSDSGWRLTSRDAEGAALRARLS
jgi:broad specificity phosphatase PhoE